MVTGYERSGLDSWWVDIGPHGDYRRTHVGPVYRGPNLDNFHYHVRCRTARPEDVEIIEVTGGVQAGPSDKPSTTWKDVLPGDLVASGAILQLDPGATLVWRSTDPAQSAGKLSAMDKPRRFRVESSGLTLLTK